MNGTFPGYVVSDWGAAQDTIGNANGGLDCEILKVLQEAGRKFS